MQETRLCKAEGALGHSPCRFDGRVERQSHHEWRSDLDLPTSATNQCSSQSPGPGWLSAGRRKRHVPKVKLQDRHDIFWKALPRPPSFSRLARRFAVRARPNGMLRLSTRQEASFPVLRSRPVTLLARESGRWRAQWSCRPAYVRAIVLISHGIPRCQRDSRCIDWAVVHM